MSEKKLFILGTAALVPTRERNHHACFLRWEKEGLLFDPGEGTLRQMIYAGVSAAMITKIFISHFHGDHCLGLAGVAQRISLDRVPHPVRIYYPESGQEYVERLLNASIYYRQATFELCPVRESGVLDSASHCQLEAQRLEHVVDCFGYRIGEADSYTVEAGGLAALGLTGKAIGELKRRGELVVAGRTIRLRDHGVFKAGKRAAFIMDTRSCSGAYELARGVDLVISEATFLTAEREQAERYGHLTAAQAATIAKEGGAKQLVLTHFSGRYPSTAPYLAEAEAIFPGVVCAEDGDQIELAGGKRGNVAGRGEG